MPLTENARAILEAIAKGHSYEQILVQELAWTYHDIFAAAAEALALDPENPTEPSPGGNEAGDKAYSVTAIRDEHAQAYVKWDAGQEAELQKLYHEGWSVPEIARHMQRQPGGIRSRLEKLDLK